VKLERVQPLKLPYRNSDYYTLGTRRGLFLSNPHHHVFRLNPDDYTVSWEFAWTHIRRTTLVGDMLIFSDYDSVKGLNAETGETRWSHKSTGAAEHGEGRLLVYLYDGLENSGYLVVDPRTGDVERHVSPPSFHGSVVRTLPDCAILRGKAHDRQTFHAFDFDAQQMRWEFSPRRHLNFTGSEFTDPAVVGMSSDESVLLFELAGHLTAVRVSDGGVVWQRKPSGQNYHRSCAGLTFILENRDLVCLDTASGDIVWRMPPPPNSPSPYGCFSLACDEIYRGLLVLSGSKSILLASPEDGTIHATYPVPSTVLRVDVWNEGLLAILRDGRADLLATSETSAPKRKPARMIALSTPSSVEHYRRAEQQRAKRLSPPRPAPVPTIEVIASIPTGTAGTPRIPTPVVGPNGVFFLLLENNGTFAGIRKLARSTYERVWETPPSEVEPAWATDAHLVCGRYQMDRVEVLDTADGRSLWSTESQRGESWPWRDLIVTSPYEPAEIRLLDPATGRCERTIQRPLEKLCGVSGDLALVCAATHSKVETLGVTFRRPMDPFAVVDLETGDVKWQRAIFERWLSEHDPRSSAKIFAIGPRTAVVRGGDNLAGIDLATGDLVWEMSVVSGGLPTHVHHFAHNRIWIGGRKDSVRIVHADTGEVTDLEGLGGSVYLNQTWGDYGLSFKTESLDMYHPNGTSMRLKLRNQARAAIEAAPDLILIEPHRLRVVRLGRTVFA
jgi:outer membrane protein assembly factor BamB